MNAEWIVNIIGIDSGRVPTSDFSKHTRYTVEGRYTCPYCNFKIEMWRPKEIGWRKCRKCGHAVSTPKHKLPNEVWLTDSEADQFVKDYILGGKKYE